MVLGLALALTWWAWTTRRSDGSPGGWPGRGDAKRLGAALRLVEQVISHSQHRMKVVPFNQWVAKRRQKKGRRVD
jgi:hypothetical protein